MGMKIFTTYKNILFLLFFTISSFCFSQKTITIEHKNVSDKNYQSNYKYGQTAYQIDRTVNKYEHIRDDGTKIYVYYYYVWFYNYSYEYYGGKWNKTSTYLENINVTIDGYYMGGNWMLITGEYYYLTFWSINPNATINVNHTKPLSY